MGFELTKNGIPHEDAYEEPLCQSLFDVSGEGWKGNEMVGGVCGVFLIVEFDHLPTPEKMEEVRQEIIRVQNSSIGLPEVKRVKFIDLPLGTRFRYVGSNAEWVVLERHGCGKVAKWAGSDQSPVMQPICSAAESEAECQDLEVELADLEGGAQ